MGPGLSPDPVLLGIAVVADLALGDPVYRAHPVRLIGAAMTRIEGALRRAGAGGYAGGITLIVTVAAVAIGAVAAVMWVAGAVAAWAAILVHGFVLYSLLALGDLLRHGWRVERALGGGDLTGARAGVGRLVGRDTDRLDAAGCRRAVVESLAESLTDGFTSAVFWYAVGGLTGLVLFKVASTADSMVGYRTPRYVRFGWAGARLDDVMNYVPARLTYLIVAAAAGLVPACSLAKALRIGRAQHAWVPGPNAGWSEAAAAGALERRLVGPMWRNGQPVTAVWLGDPADPPLATRADVVRAMLLITLSGLIAAAVAAAIVSLRTST
jgi:adenosylcobinamide-phosphate synthase